MINREAKPSGPLKCLGLWTLSLDVCKSCPHLDPCKDISKNRFQGVELPGVKFNFVPQKLRESGSSGSIDELQEIYSLCYLTIFEKEPHDHIGRVDSAFDRLAEIVDEQGCSFKLFIMSVMTAAKRSSPDTVFYANMLFGPSAITRFESCREECRIQFGQFDFKSLEMTNPSAITQRFIYSETTFAKFIVDLTVRHSGEVNIAEFFLTREMSFDPFWLAIDDSYFNSVLVPHVEGRIFSTKESRKLRSVVAQARRTLIKKASRARSVFKLRESIMSEAMIQVLRDYRLSASDFLFAKEFDSPIEFWTRLGLSVRRIELLRIIGDRV